MKPPITYIPNAVSNPDEAFNCLWNELDWLRHDKVPRREYYVNAFDVPYTYGTAPFHRTYYPQQWHPELIRLQSLVEEVAGCKFEVCFLNGYENQSDQLGWHADASPEMDDERPIAIVSFGVEREIWFREKPDEVLRGTPVSQVFVISPPEVSKQKLGHGSICLMHAGMQDTHQHRIPKAGFMCGERVSLTFRGYVNT